jgi:hypothetical protein
LFNFGKQPELRRKIFSNKKWSLTLQGFCLRQKMERCFVVFDNFWHADDADASNADFHWFLSA